MNYTIEFNATNAIYYDLAWCILYIALLCWSYFFRTPHLSPDDYGGIQGYAKLTSFMRIWCFLNISLSHFIEFHLNNVRKRYDDFAYVVPLLSIYLSLFSVLHIEKGAIMHKVSYGPNPYYVVVNSIMCTITSITGIKTLHKLHYFVKSCKSQYIHKVLPITTLWVSENQTPVKMLLFHFCIGFLLIYVDYLYKWVYNAGQRYSLLLSRSHSTDTKLQNHRNNSPFKFNAHSMVKWYGWTALVTGIQEMFGGILQRISIDYRFLERELVPKYFTMTERLCCSSTNFSLDPHEANSLNTPTCAHNAVHSGVDSGNNPANKFPNFYWFDFLADTGDGFNPSYEIARLVAQPSITVKPKTNNLKELSTIAKKIVHKGTDASNTVNLENTGPLYNKWVRKYRYTGTTLESKHPVTEASDSVGDFDYILPRGDILVIGGDIVYPSPTYEYFKKKFVSVFEAALPRTPYLRAFHKEGTLGSTFSGVQTVQSSNFGNMNQRTLNSNFGSMNQTTSGNLGSVKLITSGNFDNTESPHCSNEMEWYQVILRSCPLMFILPGNHDWLDGCTLFRENVLSKSWLGGWLMPQKTTYFVIELPANWFIFAVDTGLSEDIDIDQQKYFINFTNRNLSSCSNVILLTHIPLWIIHQSTSTNEPQSGFRIEKIAKLLGKRLRMRLAGDVHHYSRYKQVCPSQVQDKPLKQANTNLFSNDKTCNNGPTPSVQYSTNSEKPHSTGINENTLCC